MLNSFVPQDTSELFVEFLDKLVINHYGILFPKRKNSPIDNDFLEVNSILAKCLFYSLRKQPFLEEDFDSFPLKAKLNAGITKEKYESWLRMDPIGAIIQYCDAIDALAYRGALAKTEATYLLICPMYTHRVEIQEYAFYLLNQKAKTVIEDNKNAD